MEQFIYIYLYSKEGTRRCVIIGKKFQSESLEFDVSRLVLRSFSRLILLVKTGMGTGGGIKRSRNAEAALIFHF